MNHLTPPPTWTAEDARTRFDDLARRAREEGPQRVTLEDGTSLLVLRVGVPDPPSTEPELPLSVFLQALLPQGLDLERDHAEGTEPDLEL